MIAHVARADCGHITATTTRTACGQTLCADFADRSSCALYHDCATCSQAARGADAAQYPQHHGRRP